MGFEFLADHRGDQAADQARRPVRAVSIWIVFDDLHSDAERAADRLGPGGAEFVSRIPAGSGASPRREASRAFNTLRARRLRVLVNWQDRNAALSPVVCVDPDCRAQTEFARLGAKE